MANVFLAIDGIEVDRIEEGDYTAYEEELGVSDRMISGRRVEELRATIWIVEVSFSSIDSDVMAQIQTVLHSSRRHLLTFLPSTGGKELISSYFHLTIQPQPTLRSWLEGNTPSWDGFTLRFEEIDGHD